MKIKLSENCGVLIYGPSTSFIWIRTPFKIKKDITRFQTRSKRHYSLFLERKNDNEKRKGKRDKKEK